MPNTKLMLGFIRLVIRVKNYKQKDLAKKTGISRSHLSELLSGKKELTLANFCKLAEALYLKPHEVMALGSITGIIFSASVFEGHVSIRTLGLLRLYQEELDNA